MNKLKQVSKYLLILPAIVIVYAGITFLFSAIPYNTSFIEEKETPVTIYLHSNGVHTDFILPAVTSFQNWNIVLPEVPPTTAYIAFGWGDKGFYLNTPTWGDLTFMTAFKAATGLSTTAMHVSYIEQTPSLSESTVKIDISKEQYLILCNYIAQSFTYDTNHSIVLVPHNSRYYSGHFYDANGSYSLFKSCNTWVNIGLKKSEIRTCLWTIFDWPLLNVYKK